MLAQGSVGAAPPHRLPEVFERRFAGHPFVAVDEPARQRAHRVVLFGPVGGAAGALLQSGGWGGWWRGAGRRCGKGLKARLRNDYRQRGLGVDLAVRREPERALQRPQALAALQPRRAGNSPEGQASAREYWLRAARAPQKEG